MHTTLHSSQNRENKSEARYFHLFRQCGLPFRGQIRILVKFSVAVFCGKPHTEKLIQGWPKTCTSISLPKFCQIITDFQNTFNERFCSKFA